MAIARITVVGSANMDLTFRTARLPRPGETAFGAAFYKGFGGKGANQAVAAARLGANVAFVGRVGDDDFGRAIRDQLVLEGIDLSHFGVDLERPTGTAAILVDDAGENAIVGVPGANLGLTPDDIGDAAELLKSSAIVMAPCETMIETITAAFRIAHDAGRMCILNPAPARELPDELLSMVDICIPNETELRMLTGQSIDSSHDILVAAESLRGRGPATVIVTLGHAARLWSMTLVMHSCPASPWRQLIPAGQAMHSAGRWRLHSRRAIRSSSRLAKPISLRAQSVTRPGTQASYPRRNELAEW